MYSFISKKTHIFFASLLVLWEALYPLSAFAQGEKSAFVPLTNLPGISPGASIPDLINGLFLISIAGGAILAVIMIGIGGLKYMASGGNMSSVSDAREMILNAVIGLILILATFIIFNTINSRIVANLDLSKSIYGITVTEKVSRKIPIFGENQQGSCAKNKEEAVAKLPRCKFYSKAESTEISCTNKGEKLWIISDCSDQKRQSENNGTFPGTFPSLFP